MSDFSSSSFDVVLDKAAMDALMVQEGDVWNPSSMTIDKARAMCSHVSRILKPQGKFLQISFAQPHFRKKYLLGWHVGSNPSCLNPNGDDILKEANRQSIPTALDENMSSEFQWSFHVEKIAEKGCFETFLYVMIKQ